MKLYVLFGQRVERYAGEYGIEALECMSEYGMDDNSEYLFSKKEEYDKGKEFSSLEIVELEVNEKELMKFMVPVKKLGNETKTMRTL